MRAAAFAEYVEGGSQFVKDTALDFATEVFVYGIKGLIDERLIRDFSSLAVWY